MRRMKRRLALLLLLAALLACVPVSAAGGSYTDVPKTHWAYSSIRSATQRGLLQGVGGNKFGLKQEMSRAAYAAALCRLMGWQTVAPAEGSFSDNQDAQAWYYSAIETAYANGVLTKQSAFCRPTDAISREEMAVMTVRALGYTALSGLVQESCPFSDVSTNRGYVTLAYQMGLVTGIDAFSFAPQRKLTREEAAVVLMRVYERKSAAIDRLFTEAPASAVRVESMTGTSGSVPLSPRAPLEAVYAAAVGANGGAVVLHATPLRQTVQNGKAGAGEEIPKTEVVELIEKGAQVYRSARYQSSYLLYKDGGKTKVVWYESDADLAEKVMLCRLLGVKTVYIEK